MAAAATAAADITAEAEGGKVADVVEADEEGFTMPSSSRIDRLELALVAAEPSVCCGCCWIWGPEEVDGADEERGGDDVEFFEPAATNATEVDEELGALPVAEERLFNSEPIDSSRCHLEFNAALICVQSSFLHDFELQKGKCNVNLI